MILFLAVLAFLATLAVAALTYMANAMSDNPGAHIAVWPVFAVGLAITATLAFAHFHPVP
jgi:hypothetical protein